MLNARNAEKFQKINERFLSDIIPHEDRAREYAQQILLIEAEAVIARSTIAIQLGLEGLIKNQKYIQFVRNENCVNLKDRIHVEMVENGTVHRGKIKALDHYMRAYFERVKLNYSRFSSDAFTYCEKHFSEITTAPVA